MPTVTLQSTNLFGTFGATAEDDGRVITLYLVPIGGSHGAPRALAVRNRIAAPMDDDGVRPPVIPQAHTREPEGGAPLTTESTRLVWSEHGDGVALFENDALVAYIPAPYDTEETAINATGYSVFAIGDYRWSRELDVDRRLRAEEYFLAAEHQFNAAKAPDFWGHSRSQILRQLEERFGTHTGYWAGEADRIPSLAIASFEVAAVDGATLYCSVGMSALPLPQAPEHLVPRQPSVDGALVSRRCEVALVANGTPEWAPTTIAWLARYPWANSTAIGHGDIILAPGLEPAWFAPDCSAVLMTESPFHELPRSPVEPEYSSLPLLWAHPITLDQQRFASRHGSAALISRLHSPSSSPRRSIIAQP